MTTVNIGLKEHNEVPLPAEVEPWWTRLSYVWVPKIWINWALSPTKRFWPLPFPVLVSNSQSS